MREVYLCVEGNGDEYIFSDKPKRLADANEKYVRLYHSRIQVPNGTIKKLIGRTLTWKDEPVLFPQNEHHKCDEVDDQCC